MAITTVDGLIAGSLPFSRFFYKAASLSGAVVGRPVSYWGVGGIPGAGSYDNTLNGVALSAPQNGQIPWVDPPGGSLSYLQRFCGAPFNYGQLLLCDRLWHNGGYTITSTSAQNSTTPSWPARDNAGSTDGEGVLLGLEISSGTGAGTPTVTVSYTNSSGAAGRSATNSFATAASTGAGTMYPIGLQAGDIGVRSVQSLTLSSTWTSGTMNLVAYRVIASLDIAAGYQLTSIDAVSSGFPQIYNGSVPYLIYVPGFTGQGNCFGSIHFAQG